MYQLVPEEGDGNGVLVRRPRMVSLHRNRGRRRRILAFAAVPVAAVVATSPCLVTRSDPSVAVRPLIR